jgi:hypothetical protein
MIRIRFVTCTDLASRLIRMQAGVSMPFTPSHCEALAQDGKSYIGAHFDGGVKDRLVGYDDATRMALPDGTAADRIIALPWTTPGQETMFYNFVVSRIGQPYDWKAIFGFQAPDFHTHLPDHVICSAFMVAGLREAGVFQWPLTVPFHHITPRDLMLMLSSHVEVSH